MSMNFDLSQLMQKRSAATQQLVQTFKEKGDPNADPLTSLAVKRQSDTLKITNYMVKQRLTQELDETVSSYVKDHPEIKDDYYVAYIKNGDQTTTEVLPLNAVTAAVQDADPEEAKKFLTENRQGFFKPENFTLKTEAGSAYEGLKRKLDAFLKERESVFRYLQGQTDAIDDPKELLDKPS